MVNLNDALQTRYASQEDLINLQKAFEKQKAIQGTEDSDVMITIDYDKDLQNLVTMQSPFLRYCEGAGMVTGATRDKVGVRRRQKATTSSFIGEKDDIPAFDTSTYTDEVVKMKTLVYPIEISDLSLKGVDAADLLTEEINDGYLDIAQSKDKGILQGKGTTTAKDFEGLITSTTTNTHDNTGAVLDLDTVDNVAQDIVDAGGSPSAIVTTAKVQTQLKNMMESKQRVLDKVDLNIGIRVVGYNAPNGQTIPIIVDPNIDTTGIEGHVLQFVDKRAYRIRELQAPMTVDFAKTKLSTSKAIYTWLTAYNRNEKWGGKIIKIGDTE
jgi:hypothetical protein